MKNSAIKDFLKLETVPLLRLKHEATKLRKKPLDKPHKQAKFLRKLFDKDTFNLREEMIVLLMGNDMVPIGYFSLAKGSKGEVKADFQYLVSMLLFSGAEGFIFAHNHPQGKAIPSDADFEFTLSLKHISDFFSIVFFDHIVLTDKKYYSFDENGLLW